MIPALDLLKEKGFDWYRTDLPSGGIEIAVKKKLLNRVTIGDKVTIEPNQIFKLDELIEPLCDRIIKREEQEMSHLK